MRRLAAALLVLTFSASLAATQKPVEKKPSFSGVWIIQPPNQSAGRESTIKQDDKTITVTTKDRTTIYYLDGVAHKETKTPRAGYVVEVFTTAQWEKNAVVITFSMLYPGNMKGFDRETWSIDAKGQLVIDLQETGEGQRVVNTKIIHKKKS